MNEQKIVIAFDKEATPEQMEKALEMVSSLSDEKTTVLIVGGRPNDR
jgi:ribosomal protein S2